MIRYRKRVGLLFYYTGEVAKDDDILETDYHFKLVDYMLDIPDQELTEEIIKKFNKLLKEGTSDSIKEWFNVGEHKRVPNEVGSLKTTDPKNVRKDILSYFIIEA